MFKTLHEEAVKVGEMYADKQPEMYMIAKANLFLKIKKAKESLKINEKELKILAHIANNHN